MITGTVRSDEARIRLTVSGLGAFARERKIVAVVDTGYTGFLTLLSSVIAELGLRFHSIKRGILADGSECTFDIYVAEIIWDQKPRRTLVAEANSDPLVGMRLLRGYELKMQVRAWGEVMITRIS